MVNRSISRLSLALLISALNLPAAFADEALDARIARAKSAAPPAVSDHATVVVDGKVVVEGDNGWTCMPDTFPGDNMPMCNDAVWMEMLGAMMNKQDFDTKSIGFSYMLQGDKGAGVSNSDPFHPDHKNADDYVETGPHLMIIVPRAMLSGLTDDPSTGGPYVMWKDTPYAHIMLPVEDQ
ncbi:hypothetical protein [Photobacterium sp. TY1-4]|uniref:hypothetical protein n=1 Tax=Photobacterium sp. TY1-4 TaxID=2899122 RepID=UPI0021C1B06B|nr:hypothetical protein [Photobacterium sp. TY1-4]UXI02665.1 hypothetical protein NH461_07855 [Photobacterium sp. TY1-4]